MPVLICYGWSQYIPNNCKWCQKYFVWYPCTTAWLHTALSTQIYSCSPFSLWSPTIVVCCVESGQWEERKDNCLVPGEGLCQQLWSECALALFTQDGRTDIWHQQGPCSDWWKLCFSIRHAWERYKFMRSVPPKTAQTAGMHYTCIIVHIHMQHLCCCTPL